jgi:hypothetical protein
MGSGDARNSADSAREDAHRADAARGPTSKERLGAEMAAAAEGGCRTSAPAAAADSNAPRTSDSIVEADDADAAAERDAAAALEAVRWLAGHARVVMLSGDPARALVPRGTATAAVLSPGSVKAASLGHRHVHLLAGSAPDVDSCSRSSSSGDSSSPPSPLVHLLAHGAPLLIEGADGLLQLNQEQTCGFEDRVTALAVRGGFRKVDLTPPGHFVLAAPGEMSTL